jgi:hypothetical protein
VNFKIVDADGKELAMSRDFAAKLKLPGATSHAGILHLQRNYRLEQDNLTRWLQE